MKGKILLLIILAIAAFFIYSSFFGSSFEQGLAELRTLEANNSAKEAFLIPITKQGLKNYKSGLVSLKIKYGSNTALRNVFEIKNDLALIQENLLEISDNFERANKLNPNCVENSRFDKVKKLSENTLQKVNTVLAKRNAFLNNFSKESVLVEEISKTKFEHSLLAIQMGIGQIQKIVSSYC